MVIALRSPERSEGRSGGDGEIEPPYEKNSKQFYKFSLFIFFGY